MEWVEGGGKDFVGGEKVTLSVGGGRGVVYQCAKQWREYDLVLFVEFVLFEMGWLDTMTHLLIGISWIWMQTLLSVDGFKMRVPTSNLLLLNVL
jgi:hypothetical protein